MNKRIYKYSLITELTIAFLLFVFVVITGAGRLSFIASPYGFYGFTGPAFLLLISFLIAFLFTKLINADRIKTNEEDLAERKELRDFNFWKFSFFTNLTFSIGYLLFLLALNLIFTSGECNSDIFIIIILAVTILSLIIGALLLSTSALWATNKLSALITLAVGLFFFTSLFIFSFVIVHDKMKDDIFVYDEAVPAQDNYDNEERNDDDEETNEPDLGYLSYIWDYPERDEENIKGALRFSIYNILDLKNKNTLNEILRYYYMWIWDYDMNIEDNQVESGHLELIVNTINRNPIKLKGAFYSYSDLLYQIMPKEIYTKSNLDKTIEALIISHNEIYSKSDPNQVLNDIYKIMSDNEIRFTPNKENPKQYDDAITSYVSESVIAKLNSQRGVSEDYEMYVLEEDLVWIYSFWARRNNEGNIDEVFEIITAINNHYSKSN